MNIPMAYDVVPTEQIANGVVVNQGRNGYGMQSVVVGSNLRHGTMARDHLDQPLLLSDQEAQWQQEMAHEGIGHLPVSWYRQTPTQAVWGAYGLINRIISALVNFGINVGLGYAILHNNDEVGLWQKPSEWGEKPYASAAWSDLFITTFCIAFFTTILSTKGIRNAMKSGQIVPVEHELLKGGCYRCTPVNMFGTCTRSLMLSLWACVTLGIAVNCILEVVCLAGGLHGHGSQCSMEAHVYIYVKAAYSVVAAWIIYPFVLLMTLNTHTLPPLDLTFFAQNQRERFEKEQREKQPEPM
jgi:hypothetical protein